MGSAQMTGFNKVVAPIVVPPVAPPAAPPAAMQDASVQTDNEVVVCYEVIRSDIYYVQTFNSEARLNTFSRDAV